MRDIDNSLTRQGVQHRGCSQVVTHPVINHLQQGLTLGNSRVFTPSFIHSTKFFLAEVCVITIRETVNKNNHVRVAGVSKRFEAAAWVGQRKRQSPLSFMRENQARVAGGKQQISDNTDGGSPPVTSF